MKAKRTKGGNRNSKPKDHGHVTAEQKILENGELTVQKLSSEVAGRTQKYTKLGALEFVRFPNTEVTIDHKRRLQNAFWGRALIGMRCFSRGTWTILYKVFAPDT